MEQDLVSVVVPVYNAEKYLARCIESILKQTYYNIELILVNDGSSDSSAQICETYQKKDSRVKYFVQKNKGPSEARNYGIKESSGTKLCFVDSDDTIVPEFVELMHNASVDNDCEYVTCNFAVADGRLPNFLLGVENSRRLSLGEYEEEFIFNLPPRTHVGGCINKLYDLSIIRLNHISFPSDMRYAEDYVFDLDYIKYVSHIYLLAEPLYLYSLDNAESLTRKRLGFCETLNRWDRVYLEFCKRYSDRMDNQLKVRVERGYVITYLECFDLAARVGYSEFVRAIKNSLRDETRKNTIMKTKLIRKYPHFIVHLLFKMHAYFVIRGLLYIRK